MIRIKRAYDPPAEDDGRRILVDRLWPRGLAKDRARIDSWLKELAPSSELRGWFAHKPQKWKEFRERYLVELAAHAELVDELRREGHMTTVTLLFAARDAEHNNAVVLKELLTKQGAAPQHRSRSKGKNGRNTLSP